MQYKLLVKKISVSADKKIKQKEYLSIGKLPIIDQGKQLIGGYSDDLSKQISCNLPVIIFGDHTKNVKLIPFQFAAGADGIKVLEPKNNISPKYLYYGTLYLTFRIEDKGYARHYQHIEKQDLPVPSLPEQERIVARIEELFSELDKSVETLKKTKAQLAVYRQAVLKEAFDFNGDDIIVTNLNHIISVLTDYHANGSYETLKANVTLLDTPDYAIMVRSTNYENNDFSNDVKYINKHSYDFLKKSQLFGNEVLMGKIGNAGRVYFAKKLDKPMSLAMNMFAMRFIEDVDSKYVYYYLLSPTAKRDIKKYVKGVGTPTIDKKSVRAINIKYPQSKLLQQNIVREIESKLSICDSIEKTVDSTLQQAEAMRQSILKQAFEGGI